MFFRCIITDAHLNVANLTPFWARRRVNNYRPQGGKTYSPKPRRVAFALFHRFYNPLSDGLADSMRTGRSAELSTCQPLGSTICARTVH